MYVARRACCPPPSSRDRKPSSVIPITVPVRIRVTQRRELEGEHILRMRQRQGFGIRNGLLEPRAGADRCRFVEDRKTRQRNWRHVRIVLDVLGDERGEPLVAAEEHLSVPPSLVTAPREVVAPQAVRDVVVPERLCPRIESGQALLAADPQRAGVIFEDAHHIVARQAMLPGIAREDLGLWVEPIQARSQAEPERSRAVLMNGANAATLQSVWITRFRRVVHEAVRLLVKAAQDAAPRPEPKRAGAIAMNRRDACMPGPQHRPGQVGSW